MLINSCVNGEWGRATGAPGKCMYTAYEAQGWASDLFGRGPVSAQGISQPAVPQFLPLYSSGCSTPLLAGRAGWVFDVCYVECRWGAGEGFAREGVQAGLQQPVYQHHSAATAQPAQGWSVYLPWWVSVSS